MRENEVLTERPDSDDASGDAPLATVAEMASGGQSTAALEAALEGIALYDRRLNLLYANPAYCRTYGCESQADLARELARGQGWEALVQAGERTRLTEEVFPTLWKAGQWRGRIRSRRLAEETFEAEAPLARNGEEIFEADLSLARSGEDTFVTVVRDVTAELRRREGLAAREHFFRLVAQHSTDLIALHELDGTFVYVSPSIRRLTGFETREILGELPWDRVHPEHRGRVRDCFAAAARGEGASASYRLRARSGEYIWFETLARPVHLAPDRPDEVIQIESSSRDVSARKELELQLSHQALHDPLTGLPNRSLFMNRLRQAPGRAARKGLVYGVIFLDLDHFKQINDTLGHAAGDELLVGVAERLADAVRDTDTVARLSGDEFAVLLEELHEPGDAEILASRLLEAFETPFELAGNPVDVHPSLGVAVREDPAEEPETLLRYADMAMYAAKRKSGPSYRVHTAGPEALQGGPTEDLARALETDGLRLVYQPVFRLEDARPVGLEALLRWTRPGHGEVNAREVLAVAERGGLGPRLTRWVLRRACRDAGVWLGKGAAEGELALGLNLSADELARPDLPDAIEEAARRADVPIGRLQVEIRPRGLRRDASPLEALRARGIRVALDDFGRDPVSLPLLGRLPVDVLKIDPALVESLPEENGGAGGARAVLGIGRRLGLEVVAEGIETESQLDRLRQLGCERGQGFLLARPLATDDVATFLSRSRGVH